MKLLDRLESVDGEAIEGLYDREHIAEKESAHTHRLVAGGTTVEHACEKRPERTFRLLPATPQALVSGRAPAAMRLLTLRSGEPLLLQVPEGERPGPTVEVTGYPLILSARNRVPAGRALPADPGSYLILARRQGFEDQRYPVVVEAGAEVQAKIDLLETGTTPAGFVHVPPGPFVYGGDPEGGDGLHQVRGEAGAVAR